MLALISKKMKAVKKFKGLLGKTRRPDAFGDALGQNVRTLRRDSTGETIPDYAIHKSKSTDLDDRRNVQQALATEGIHLKPDTSSTTLGIPRLDKSVTILDDATHNPRSDESSKPTPLILHPEEKLDEDHSEREKGHAHDPLDEEPLFLGIGAGGDSLELPQQEIVAESPTAAEFSIYDTAYQQEVERIREAQGDTATVYLTRRVDSKKEYKADTNMVDAPASSEVHGAHTGFKNLLDRAREKPLEPPSKDKVGGTNRTFTEIAAKAVENTKLMGKDFSNRSSAALDSFMEKARDMKKERAERKDGPS